MAKIEEEIYRIKGRIVGLAIISRMHMNLILRTLKIQSTATLGVEDSEHFMRDFTESLKVQIADLKRDFSRQEDASEHSLSALTRQLDEIERVIDEFK